MRRLRANGWAGVLLLTILWPAPVQAEFIEFHAGYPKAGPNPGEIHVQGRILIDDGWRIRSHEVYFEVISNGGDLKECFGKLYGSGPAYTFEGFAKGLEPGMEYSVIVDVFVIHGRERFAMRTAIGSVTTKKSN